MLTYPWTKKSWNRFFIWGPVLTLWPKKGQNGRGGLKFGTSPTVFKLGSSSFQGMLTYPWNKKLWSGFLVWGSVLALWPKKGAGANLELLPQFLSWEAHLFRECWPNHGPKNNGTDFLFEASFWRYGPKKGQNGRGGKFRTTPTVFKLGSSSFQGMLTYPWTKQSWNGFFIWGPVLMLWPRARLQ